MRRCIPFLLVLSALCCSLPVRAQFLTMGADPGGLRWRSIDTPTYRVIYPVGLDSLARVYAVELERVAAPVGASLGFTPNQSYRRRQPVVLHAWTAYGNGQVTWMPRRTEMLTMPDLFAPEPTPWVQQLSVHESRHVAQMQYAAARPFRPLRVLTGQLAAGALAAVYCGLPFFEGDAVTAETALSATGRGRSADFLEYYRVSFAAGDWRNYRRWRYGSQRYYTPDYYRAGYLAVGGIRALYDVPDLTDRYYRRLADKGGLVFGNWNKTVREATGVRFRDAFAAVSASLQEQWAADEAARAPFMPSEAVSAVPRRFLEYTGLKAAGEDLIAQRSGLTEPARLVRIAPDGTAQPLRLLGASVSAQQYSPATGLSYWSELVRDPRWPLRSYSRIYSTDGSHTRRLTRKTRYYHPAPAPDAPVLSVTEAPADGSSRVVVLDALDGSVLRTRRAPDGLQFVETVWVGDTLYASGITDEGFGFWRVDDLTCVLTPRPVKIKQLWAYEGQLMFTCDLSGVGELYSLDPGTGSAPLRLTNTRFGASDFAALRDTLFYAVLQPEGRLVHKTAIADLRPQEADFSALPRYPFAEELAAGEPLAIDRTAEVSVGEPHSYSKLAHLFRFHSWLPIWFAFDSVDNLSFESLSQDAGLGATAFFQNDLGTASGLVGYHAAPRGGVWYHSGHATFNYTGLYPVLEASVDFGDRSAYQYYLEEDTQAKTRSMKARKTGVPSLTGRLRAYIPWNFSSGGYLRGLVPSASWLFSNDQFPDETVAHRTTFSLRAYSMQRTPASRVYPRFGVGAEVGYSFRWTPGLIAPSAYAYLYGYLPGLHPTHGLRWSALASHRLGDAPFSESFANTAPRGFPSAVTRRLSAYQQQFKVALDYKLPLLPVDRAILGPVAYLRNFELTLHGDYTAFRAARQDSAGNLFSVGADLAAVLGNLAWIPYPTRIGVSWNYNGGASFEAFATQENGLERHVVSLIFSVDF